MDRLTGRKWGYYGRNDDGAFANNLTPGNNTTDAILFDQPSRSSSMTNIWWQSVSASVSIDGGQNSCTNNFLGYYFWSWIVDDARTTSDDKIVHAVAWENLQNIMDDAVAAWNSQAPGLGHNTFPTFNKLMYLMKPILFITTVITVALFFSCSPKKLKRVLNKIILKFNKIQLLKR